MKRLISVLLAILSVCLLSSCKFGEAEKNDNRANIEYVDTDLEHFINSWGQNQHVNSDGNINAILSNDFVENLIVPELHNLDFVFHNAKVFRKVYQYFYRPAGSQMGSFSYDTGIWISIAREKNTFDAVVEQYKLEVIDDMAYDSQRNCWHLNVDTHRVTINLPSNVVFESSQQVRENFSFEIITGSQTSSSVQ